MDGLIGISKAWCDWAGRRRLPSVWIPSFADDRGRARAGPSTSDRSFTLAFIGHWIRREQPCVFLEAMRICLGRGLDIRMNVIGDIGKLSRERAAMRFLRRHPDLRERINFLGFVSDEERDRQLADADAFVLLRADNRETDMLFPTRLPEYMLTGNPVVLSKVGSFPYCFEHRKDVWFVSKENSPEEVADALTHLARNPEERLEIGRRGRQSALEQFSLEVLGRRLAEFLTTVAARRAAAGPVGR
jgi:glycosyltransferase involved in cell wall biosynthesis